MTASDLAMPEAAARPTIPAPTGLLAELTHRCPLHCPYCSNPLELDRRSRELSTGDWYRVFDEAAALGVLHVHLSGGEPAARADLDQLVARCAALALYSNLITAGVSIAPARLDTLAAAGLDHVQLSIQGADAATTEQVSGLPGAHARKLAFAREVRARGLPLTINAVIHRANVDQVPALVALAAELGAKRIEIAHAQYYGWAALNRRALLPSRAETMAAVAAVEDARARYAGVLVIDSVLPDYYARRPKACMSGWGRTSLNVTPSGKALPCHAAETIPGLAFWNVRERSLADIWHRSPAFNVFRGTDWMPEPCRGCDRREIDWGGCRCQALALTGDAAATDPACERSPLHHLMREIAEAETAAGPAPYLYRDYRSPG